MKNLKIIMLVAFVVATLVHQGCRKAEVLPGDDGSILPEEFNVEIPSSISYESITGKSSNKTGGSTIMGDTLNGNRIYHHLATFIHVGSRAGHMVHDIMRAIRVHGIDQAMRFSFTSKDDGRVKNVVVIEQSRFKGKLWEFELLITDALCEQEPDGGKALQVFWDRKPVVGIAIVKPYNLNKKTHITDIDAMFEVDYSARARNGYQKSMIVSASGLTLRNKLINPFDMKSLKMFVGKKGNRVDIYGNSSHPNAVLFTDSIGFNWAFVASADTDDNIAVAEVGLPPSLLDETDRDILLKDYAIKTVFEKQIYQMWPNISPKIVEAYLYNAEAPGYFGKGGFIQGGTAPDKSYADLENNILQLAPYSPKKVTLLQVEFK